MKRIKNEKQLLRQLGIPDFRHLSKEKVMKFATTLPYVDPEVAKAVLEKIPEFTQTTTELLDAYRQFAEKSSEENAKSVEHLYQFCDEIGRVLSNELEKEIPFEQKQYYISQLIEIAKLVKEVDENNKKFHLYQMLLVGGIVATIIGTIASLLGSHIEVGESKSDENEQVQYEYESIDE